jgi:hypothetical protein
MVAVPKKLPAIGCRNSLRTACGYRAALAAYATHSSTKIATAMQPIAPSIRGLVPN